MAHSMQYGVNYPVLPLSVYRSASAVAVKEDIDVLKTIAQLKAETASLLAATEYIDFLKPEDMTYLNDIIRGYHNDLIRAKSRKRRYTDTGSIQEAKQGTIPERHIQIKNKLLEVAEEKYMLDPATIEMLKETMDIYKIHETIDNHIRSRLLESAIDSNIFTEQEIADFRNRNIDTVTLGKKLRLDLLNRPPLGNSLPKEIKDYLTTIDPYIVLAFIDKFLSYSGEGIDLLIQPRHNVFGFLYSMDIHPLYKIVIELMLIRELTQDDKTDKRELRLKFLLECIAIPELVKLYYSMYIYLNCYDETQPIALIVSGGNLITLFAKLMFDISKFVRFDSLIIEHKEVLQTFLRKFPNDYENIQHLFNTLATIIKKQNILSKVLSINSMVFSDLDFKLICLHKLFDKMKSYQYVDAEQLLEEFIKHANSQSVEVKAQFFLGRGKSRHYSGIFSELPEIRKKLGVYRKQYTAWLNKSCFIVVNKYKKDLHGILDKTILSNIFPSQMQKKYLHELQKLSVNESDPYNKIQIDNCKKYLLFLAHRKTINDLTTKANIDIISQNGQTGPLMQTVTTYTRGGNRFIVQFIPPKTREIPEHFLTFNSIMTKNNGRLPTLVASLLKDFLTNPIYSAYDVVAKYDPTNLEENKITYDYSRTADSASYENRMKQCESIITFKIDSRGNHIIFLGLDTKDYSASSVQIKSMIAKTIEKAKQLRKSIKLSKSSNPTKSTKSIKVASYASTKSFNEFASSLFNRDRVLSSVNLNIEPDDSVYTFGKDTYIFGDIFNPDSLLPEMFLDDDIGDTIDDDDIDYGWITKKHYGGFKNNMVKKKTFKNKKPRARATLKHKIPKHYKK